MEIFSLLALHPSSLQTDLLLHFLLKETNPDTTGPVSAHRTELAPHTHLNKIKGMWLFIWALLSDKMTLKQAKPFPKKLNTFIPRIHTRADSKPACQSWRNKRCFPEQKCLVKPYSAFYFANSTTAVHFPTYFHLFLLNNQMLFAKRHNCLAGLTKQKWHTLQQKTKGKNLFWKTVFLRQKKKKLTTGCSQFLSPILPHLTLQRIRRFWTAGRVEFSFCPVTRCLSSTTWTASGLLAEHRRKNTGIASEHTSSVPGSHYW